MNTSSVVSDNVTCNNCGWVHFAVTKAYAKGQTKQFCDFWDTQEKHVREHYWNEQYQGPMPAKYPREKHYAGYLTCNRCGESYKNFRESKLEDSPIGCTIGPILDFREFNANEGISL